MGLLHDLLSRLLEHVVTNKLVLKREVVGQVWGRIVSRVRTQRAQKVMEIIHNII